jgi:hypothetical protein
MLAAMDSWHVADCGKCDARIPARETEPMSAAKRALLLGSVGLSDGVG